MKNVVRFFTLLALGGSLYGGVRLLFYGEGHWSMWLVGGVAFLFVCGINRLLSWEVPFLWQVLLVGILLTLLAFCFGFFLSLWIGENGICGHFFGTLSFNSFRHWLSLSAPALLLDDYVSFWGFGAEQPRYYTLLRWNHA